MTMTRICKKKEIQRISIDFFILLQGYPKSVLEGHCPAEFRTVALQEQDWAPALVHILYSSITVCNIKKQALLSGTVKLNQSQSQKSQSQLYCQFCHMYRTYRELKLRYSLTPWCIQITLNTNSRTQKYR